ncbi:hypothetical protein PVAND_003104 [Polypedilum vanderplanki]|uniref:Uncharacterized protein n=1 Tax=Polypedilum vanderplanki TaxID=319348 RepID=A0A9J6BTG4_POLVA|nr:hypothetical protein PVAND_003104 [Polypedilum vanderplanki]
MKFLTVLLIFSVALLCISEVVSSPIQIKNNNMGDVTSIKIDINGEIHNIINVEIINIVLTLLQETGHIDTNFSDRVDVPHLDELIKHINSRK